MLGSPALSKSSFCKQRKFLLQKKRKKMILVHSLKYHLCSLWVEDLLCSKERLHVGFFIDLFFYFLFFYWPACWWPRKEFDCRAAPATHREALKFWVRCQSGRNIFWQFLLVTFFHNFHLSWGSRRSSLHFPYSPESCLSKILSWKLFI